MELHMQLAIQTGPYEAALVQGTTQHEDNPPLIPLNHV